MTKLEEIRDAFDLKLVVKQSGSHFFDPEAMRFFRSRLNPTIEHMRDAIVFITSEQFVTYYPSYHAEPRRYTLRKLTPDFEIVELGEFQQYPNLRAAKAAMRKYLEFSHSLP